MKSSQICDDKTKRRLAIKDHRGPDNKPNLNGIDYIEVDESDQRKLHVHLLDKAPENITKNNVRIDGGRRIRNIQVKEVQLCDPDDPDLANCLEVTVDKAGDFSTYTLCLVETDKHGQPTNTPLHGFEQRYNCIDFSFKANCPSDLDCKTEDTCPPPVLAEPEIDYLAKDYAGFRQLILDRLALVMPDWKERHIPDIGITLVEILAYIGDYLSYYQDAVATEAYLETARQRISVHRHVRLVDYPMHEGCNARTWLFVETKNSDDLSLVQNQQSDSAMNEHFEVIDHIAFPKMFPVYALDPGGIYFITGHNDALSVSGTMLTDAEVQKLPSSDYEVFEPLLIESILLQPRDLKDPTNLTVKLRDAKDRVSTYLRGQFTAGLQQLLGQYDPSGPPSDTLLGALLAELNRLIQHGNLYDQQRFAQVMLSPETSRLIQRMQKGESLNLPLLNRLLLDDAYRQEIANSQEIHLYEAHNEIRFYTWGEQECCLPRGATSATLDDSVPVSELGPGEQTPEQQEQRESPRYLASASQYSNLKRKKKRQEPPKETSYSTEPEQPPEPARKLHLQVGDILIFEEVLGPKTGVKEDADPTHRHAVRLTRVEPGVDTLYNIPIVEIEWGVEDALPFPLCLSAIGPAEVPLGSPPDSVVRQECQLLENITIAHGNVILVDYGKTIDEDLGSVEPEQTILSCEGKDELGDIQTIPAVFRPILQQAPLTFYEPLAGDAPFFLPAIPDPGKPVSLTSAKRLLLQEPRKALPWIKLTGTPPDDGARPHGPAEDMDEGEDEDEDEETEVEAGGTAQSTSKDIEWIVQRDLLESQSDDYHFVVEMDNDGFAHLRFGDGESGRMPEVGTKFHATYRVGNGPLGNVGAETISRIVFRNTLLSGVRLQPRNLFPASGGIPPEPLAEVKLFAPHAFRSSKNIQRAITADDYARLAERNPKVQRAAATLRWTGSWYEVLVAIDPLGSQEADQALLDEITAYLEQFRRIGHDLKVVSADYVPLEIAMTICVQPHFLRGHVKAALLDAFSNRVLPNGKRGFFHQDNLTFGQGIALSKLVAIAQAIPGVQSVEVTGLGRRFDPITGELKREFLFIGPMEIAQLDNDPSFPERGKIEFKMVGGR